MVSPVRIRVPPLLNYLQSARKRKPPETVPSALAATRQQRVAFWRKSVVHSVRRRAAHAGQDVAVGVERDGYGGVP